MARHNNSPADSPQGCQYEGCATNLLPLEVVGRTMTSLPPIDATRAGGPPQAQHNIAALTKHPTNCRYDMLALNTIGGGEATSASGAMSATDACQGLEFVCLSPTWGRSWQTRIAPITAAPWPRTQPPPPPLGRHVVRHNSQNTSPKRKMRTHNERAGARALSNAGVADSPRHANQARPACIEHASHRPSPSISSLDTTSLSGRGTWREI